MTTITAKYTAPTCNRGARICVQSKNHRRFFNFNHSSRNPYAESAIEFCRALNWKGVIVEGLVEGKAGDFYVYTFLENNHYKI